MLVLVKVEVTGTAVGMMVEVEVIVVVMVVVVLSGARVVVVAAPRYLVTYCVTWICWRSTPGGGRLVGGQTRGYGEGC